MIKIIVLTALILTGFTSCKEYDLAEKEIVREPSVIAAKVDPVVSCPGCDILISVFADNGDSSPASFSVRLGNIVINKSSKDELEFTIPENLSEVFGEEIGRKYRSKGYADVPLKVELDPSENSALKFFRIASDDYEQGPFDINPDLKRVAYEVEGSAQSIDIFKHSTIVFTPGYLSGLVTFSVKDIKVDDLAQKEYAYYWFISSSSQEYPEPVEINTDTGEAVFSFQDSSSGAPVVGKFRFTLVVKPKNSYSGTGSARYGTDFHTFVFDTTGGPLDD